MQQPVKSNHRSLHCWRLMILDFNLTEGRRVPQTKETPLRLAGKAKTEKYNVHMNAALILINDTADSACSHGFTPIRCSLPHCKQQGHALKLSQCLSTDRGECPPQPVQHHRRVETTKTSTGTRVQDGEEKNNQKSSDFYLQINHSSS